MCTQKKEAWLEEQKIYSAWGFDAELVICIVSNTKIFLFSLNSDDTKYCFPLTFRGQLRQSHERNGPWNVLLVSAVLLGIRKAASEMMCCLTFIQ